MAGLRHCAEGRKVAGSSNDETIVMLHFTYDLQP
jgi:hypothetical protein